ncbi:MAG: 2-nitropropane dioxygenase [Euryarchaeota archaeon]|nr:2-nitropropane dioxygenase [Euryarchaeota archaeon]MDC0045874.1 nitronate monooxygenase [Candidatus Poseidoniales archaeon]MDC0149852.1 nitronate monooxygenase [Candidatus Poseidoniales archaeon]
MSTSFTEHAGVEHPIICGAMYPCSNPELVAAAANGGGMAILQPVSLTYVHGWDLREGIRYIRSLTDQPIGFNALIEKGSKKYIERMSEWIDIALEEDIRFFVTSLGKPDWVCERVHAKGGFVYHDVTTRKHALKGIECGVDGLICVNNRAGGHLGTDSAAAMYAELSDLETPLICAGGIGSEEELSEVMAMGYAGVQMGTRFIATSECNSPDDYKQAIVDASEEDIVWTNRLTGVPISVIRSEGYQQENSWVMRKWLSSRWKHSARMFLNLLSFTKLRRLEKGKGSTAKKKEFFSAGKSVETVHSVESATVIMARLGQSLA